MSPASYREKYENLDTKYRVVPPKSYRHLTYDQDSEKKSMIDLHTFEKLKQDYCKRKKLLRRSTTVRNELVIGFLIDQ